MWTWHDVAGSFLMGAWSSARVPGQIIGSGLEPGRGIESVYGCGCPQPAGHPPWISSAGAN